MIYTARIQLRTSVSTGVGESAWFAGAELRVQKRAVANWITVILIEHRALGGVRWAQWQAVYDSLRRRWGVCTTP
jgi:hypothetical protein